MKRILSAAIVFASLAGFAGEVSVSDVEVRQLWPWSGDIDIGFTVEGGNTAVKFTAEYDGVEPFAIPEGQLSGDFFDAAPGRRHVRWSLARAGLDSQKLKNLKITASVDDTDRTYLILNLNDGSYRYAAAEPEDRWTSDPANYQTNIVFRRIPKGTKKLGLTDDLYEKVVGHFNFEKEHEVTLTSDYYISVFMITQGQQQYIINKAKGKILTEFSKPRVFGSRTYCELRGNTNETDGIDWPNTKYAVAYGSMVSNVRSIVSKTFPSEWIVDIPTSGQWEYAAKGTTPFDQLYSVGGDVDSSREEITNLIDKIAIWGHNYSSGDKNVGQKAANGYGIYDVIGLGFEWVADRYYNNTSPYKGTDPVGPTTGTGGYRLRRSMGTSYASKDDADAMDLKFYTTAYCTYVKGFDRNSYGYRLCINLKSLFK